MANKKKTQVRPKPTTPAGAKKSLKLTFISDHDVNKIQDLPAYLKSQGVQVVMTTRRARALTPIEVNKPTPDPKLVKRSTVSFTAKKSSTFESPKNKNLAPVSKPENSGQPTKACPSTADLERLFPHLNITKVPKNVNGNVSQSNDGQKVTQTEAEEPQRRSRKSQRPVKVIMQPKFSALEMRSADEAKPNHVLQKSSLETKESIAEQPKPDVQAQVQPRHQIGTLSSPLDLRAKPMASDPMKLFMKRRSAGMDLGGPGVPELKPRLTPGPGMTIQTPAFQPTMAADPRFGNLNAFYRFGNGPAAICPSFALPSPALIQQPSYFNQLNQIPPHPIQGAFPIKTEIKTEPMFTEVKQEPVDDYWPALPSLPSEIELDQILRCDIKREMLPYEIQEQLEVLKNNDKPVPPPCGCNVTPAQEASYGLFYSQLGYGRTLKDIREMMEQRTGVSGPVALRIEQAVYCHREGKSQTGCPIAKEVIKRSSLDEKFLVVVKKRDGHQCDQVYMVMGIIVWDGIPRPLADQAYATIKEKVSLYGHQMERHCEANSAKTCACQGPDPSKEGMSYSFGCSWNCYYNTCKFAKSGTRARKFHLTNRDQERFLEAQINELADVCSPLLERIAPQAFFNMTVFNTPENVCRVGTGPIEKRPFSGTSTVLDFCAHAHHDANNMNNGTTMVVTLLKPENREFGKPRTDRQLHVLPNYRAADEDEFGSREGQIRKIKTGALEALNEFNRIIGIRKFRKTRPKSSRAMGMSCAKKKRITPEMISREREKMVALMQRHSSNVPQFMNPGSQYIIPQTDGANDLNDSGYSVPSINPGMIPYRPQLASHPSPDDSISYVSQSNRELFSSRDIGGLAFELEHGTVLIESAKHENHATTALVNPDRNNPTRIGLVFYQHKNLIYPRHGNDEVKVKEVSKFQRYYKMMQNGMFIPTERQLSVMLDQGFKFPSTVLVAPPRKPRDGAGHELPLDIISSTHGCYFITNPTMR